MARDGVMGQGVATRAAGSGISRRTFLGATGAATAGAVWVRTDRPARAAADGDVFTLGIASGDPRSDSVVIWTRLARLPLDPLGGMPNRDEEVRWEVSTDERFLANKVVRRGVATARHEYAHSVHVDVQGLLPSRVYYYRFRYRSQISPIGRTKTAPAPHAHLSSLPFAFVSCQSWWGGYYTAYRHLTNEDVDLVFHLGDYIYEGRIPADGKARQTPVSGPLAEECFSLNQYRMRYGLFKSDPDLQAAHASFAFSAIEDDHEVGGNWVGATEDEPDKIARQANAYRAYWENMPFRPLRQPVGSQMQIYRRFSYGDLATFNLLDSRQYRSPHACGTAKGTVPCDEVYDPARTYLGDKQERWLLDGLGASQTRWNVIPQQAIFVQNDKDPSDAEYLPMDNWNGYQAARQRILDGIVERHVDNVVILTGDAHNNYAANVKADFYDPDSAVIGAELVGTSISSAGDGADMTPRGKLSLASNPHIKFFNSQRGYVRCDLTRDEWRADFKVVPYVTRTDAPISTRASFVIENGRPGLEQV